MSDSVSALWTSEDDLCVRRLQSAMGNEDLLSALLAIERAPEQRAQEVRAQLLVWAKGVREVLSDDTKGPAALMAGVRGVLADTADFRGDACDYYAPHNSVLSTVIERRRGQPILLASVWIIVARMADLAITGVGLPGHFIVRVGGEQGVLADPFNAGRPLTEMDCAEIVSELSGGALPWEPNYLTPANTRAICERVLRNIANASRRAKDWPAMYWAVRVLAEVREDDVGAALLHARMAEQLGAVSHARRLYERIVERFTGSSEATVATRRLHIVMTAEDALH